MHFCRKQSSEQTNLFAILIWTSKKLASNSTMGEGKNEVSIISFFIGPESDHWLPLPLTLSPTDSVPFRVYLIDVTLVCEDANSKLVEGLTVADVDAEDRVDNSLLQIWELRFGHKAKLLFRL